MNYCPECGSEVSDTNNFCPGCGHALEEPENEDVDEEPQPNPVGKRDTSSREGLTLWYYGALVIASLTFLFIIVGILRPTQILYTGSVITGVLVYLDARKIETPPKDINPFLWVAGTVLILPLVYVYFFLRYRGPSSSSTSEPHAPEATTASTPDSPTPTYYRTRLLCGIGVLLIAAGVLLPWVQQAPGITGEIAGGTIYGYEYEDGIIALVAAVIAASFLLRRWDIWSKVICASAGTVAIFTAGWARAVTSNEAIRPVEYAGQTMSLAAVEPGIGVEVTSIGGFIALGVVVVSVLSSLRN